MDLLPGQWKVVKERCPCICETAQTVQVWFSYFPESGGFLLWGDNGDSYTPGSTNPSIHDPHTLAYCQFRYDGADGTPRMMHYRLLTVTEDAFGHDHYALGPERKLIDRDGTGLLLTETGEDTIVVDDPGPGGVAVNYFTGVAGVADIEIRMYTQFAALDKHGFAPYTGVTGKVGKFYKAETASGGYLTLPPAPAIVYSGQQQFVPDATDSDPTGTYLNGLSADLRLSGFASAPIGDARISKTFGTVVDTETTRSMIQTVKGHPQTLSLVLSDEYTTDDLTAAVQAGIDGQLADGDTLVLEAGEVAENWLTAGESHCERRQSQLRILAPAPRVYADPGDAVGVEIRWVRRVTDLDSGIASESTTRQLFACFVDAPQPKGPGIGRTTMPDADFAFNEPVPLGNTLVELVGFVTDPQEIIAAPFALELFQG